MPQPITRSFDRWLFAPTLRKMIMDEMNRPSTWNSFVGNQPFTKEKGLAYITRNYGGLGPMQIHGETVPLPWDQPIPGYTKQTPATDYGIAVSFSRNVIEDELIDAYVQAGKGMAGSLNLLKDLITAQMMANAFVTTYYTAPDGAAILSASHLSSGGGGSRTNILSTSADLSYQSAQDLITVGLRQKDLRGYPNPAWKFGDTITIGYQPEDWGIVNSLFSAGALRTPGTNWNDPNALKQFTFIPVVNPFLDVQGTAGRLFFFVSNPTATDGGIYFVNRRDLDTADFTHPLLKYVSFSATARFGLHIEDWKRWYGSGY